MPWKGGYVVFGTTTPPGTEVTHCLESQFQMSILIRRSVISKRWALEEKNYTNRNKGKNSLVGNVGWWTHFKASLVGLGLLKSLMHFRAKVFRFLEVFLCLYYQHHGVRQAACISLPSILFMPFFLISTWNILTETWDYEIKVLAWSIAAKWRTLRSVSGWSAPSLPLRFRTGPKDLAKLKNTKGWWSRGLVKTQMSTPSSSRLNLDLRSSSFQYTILIYFVINWFSTSSFSISKIEVSPSVSVSPLLLKPSSAVRVKGSASL